MSSQPLVTIAIPTYNRAAEYLPAALRSTGAQTYEALEILVVDNASTDRTQEVAEGYDHPGLRYIRQSVNVGPFRNFQRCLAEARGAYLLLLSDDDRIDPDFVETCVAALDGTPDVGYVRTGLRTIDETGQTLKEWRNETPPSAEHGSEAVLAWVKNQTYWALCNTLYNTSHLRTLGGLPAEYPLTFDCHLSVQLAFAYGTVEVPGVKASFRQHQQQFGKGADVRKWAEEYLALYDLILGTAPRERRDEFRALGDARFSSLLYDYAARTSDPGQLLRNYAYVYRALGPFRRRPPLRATAKRVGETTVQWVRRSFSSHRSAGV